MTLEPAQLLAVANEAARAGARQLTMWRGRFATRQKALRDLVTDADLASEQAIRETIAGHFPDHGVLAEESADRDQLERPYCWVVDPLDGTTNYVHGFPCYGVSIAVAYRCRLVAGVVYDPERDECFTAAAGEGAWLNGKKVTASEAADIGDSLLAVSFPPHVTPQAPDVAAFLRVAPLCQAVRRTGSAALNLAYVACGRLDGHWAHDIRPWDAAAGVLLVQEAGGTATASDGSPFDVAAGNYLAAATAELHAALAPLVRP